jgi:putative acetyltransferase
MGMKLRPLTAHDANACHAVFFRAVHEGARAHYSDEQRQAWAPLSTPPANWPDRLIAGFAICATRWGKIVGFFTMGTDGHIDFAYVLPSEMGKGSAGKLYDACETHARTQGLTVLSTEASHLARRFFEKRGWRVLAKQVVIRDGVGIENYRMEKDL